ncbi:hypothetical protein A2U01_0098835, partial [Trifolium medium]|nr:hypothetical protein [Trifolium medium]
ELRLACKQLWRYLIPVTLVLAPATTELEETAVVAVLDT